MQHNNNKTRNNKPNQQKNKQKPKPNFHQMLSMDKGDVSTKSEDNYIKKQ